LTIKHQQKLEYESLVGEFHIKNEKFKYDKQVQAEFEDD